VPAELEYNTFAFGATDYYKTKCAIRPIQDDAKRTTVAVEYTIDVTFYLAGGTNADMEQARTLLTVQGGELKFSDLGLGVEIHVGPGLPTQDCMWGPATKIVSWDPLGGSGQAAKVAWQVVTTIAECDEDPDADERLMALNYDVAFALDRGGYTTMTTSGYLEIALSREEGSRKPPDTADSYRERLESRPPPLGFRRESQEYTLSPDRKRLQFRWQDRQLPREMPDDVVDIQFDVELQTVGPVIADDKRPANAQRGIGRAIFDIADGPGAELRRLAADIEAGRAGGAGAAPGRPPNRVAAQWEVRYTGAVEIARKAPPRLALDVFLRMVGERYPTGGTAAQVLWRSIRIKEDVFGRVHRFSLSARCFMLRTLVEIVTDFGLWKPATAENWNSWRASMKNRQVYTSRGHAGLMYGPEEDAIIDLCEQDPTTRTLSSKPPPPGKVPGGKVPRGKVPGKPSEDAWIEWQCWFKWVEVSNSVPHKPLPPDGEGSSGAGGDLFGTPSGTTGSATLFPGDRSSTSGGGGSMIPFPQPPAGSLYAGPIGSPVREVRSVAEDTPDIVQKAASASRWCQLWGHAIRAGGPVPIPHVVEAGGVRVVEADRQVQHGISGAAGGLPIHWASWIITYIVPEAPRGPLPVPPNARVP
jgi:hypothetical protein